MTVSSDSITQLIGPNSEDNHVNVNGLNTEHIFYPRSSSSSESTNSLSFTSANLVEKQKTTKAKTLKANWKGASRRSWFWTKLFNKVTLRACSSIRKRLLPLSLPPCLPPDPHARRLALVSHQVSRLSGKQQNKHLCLSVSFAWFSPLSGRGFRCKSPIVPHLRGVCRCLRWSGAFIVPFLN